MHMLICVTFSLPPGVGVRCGFCLWLFLDFSVYPFLGQYVKLRYATCESMPSVVEYSIQLPAANGQKPYLIETLWKLLA